EIVRQLRLRDIGGIIVVDFIDMVLESNRDLVLRQLPEATWMGADWDNPWRHHPHLDEAAQILTDRAHDLELVVHGLAHEWWGETAMERA
ncbi:MAG TPA: hypothetical protein EYQ31_08070, partial [Candidatus Handelsmanbacteria bacterium]|nr:hypothetical protein [Candidatus Handelsmanbacteria bacterium]